MTEGIGRAVVPISIGYYGQLALPGMLAAGSRAVVMTCSANARLADLALLDYSAEVGLAGFEVAHLILYLASGLAANITGSDFLIDGSLLATL
jgi:NAD(P)-dependent dehydrogenase (short-subunit alcohol dehydrogenase family)